MAPSYIIQRALYAVPIAIGVTVICFALIYLGPVDPVAAVTPDDATPEQIAMIRAAYGFDRPLPVQYFTWLGHVVTGDLGVSIQTGRPVAALLLPALANTVTLALFATIFSFTLAFGMGVLAASWHDRWPDRALSAVAAIGVSIPSYWFAIILVIVFSVELNWLPAMGIGLGGAEHWAWDFAHLKHLILPVVAISMIPIGVLARTTRAAVLEILSNEFVEALRARGLPKRRIMLHVLRNAAPTILAVSGLQFGQMLGGSILIETIFAWPGSGFLLYQAIFKRDLPVLQGTIAVIALLFVAINLLVDLLQSWLDPRIQRG
jgi:peptide/nickel transport system permease protein